jgi:hypothetical protein
MSTFDNNNFYEGGNSHDAELSRDGIVICQACGERPASVWMAIVDIGIVGVCGNCAGHLLVTTLADEEAEL